MSTPLPGPADPGAREAARRRAAGLVAVAVGLAVACTVLGLWQWQRHEDRSAAIAVVEANYRSAPVPLDAVLGSPADPLAADEVWQPVRVTGTYDADAAVLLRNRPVGGQVGFHVLVPLVVRTADGSDAVLVVDRGWVPSDRSARDVPPPDGEVEVVVRLRQDEAPSSRDAPAGQVQAISVEQVLAAAGVDDVPAYAAYGAMVSEDPAGSGRLGALPRPSTDPGSHLSYAMQWWTFALGSLVGFSILARRELSADPVAGDPGGTPGGTPGGGEAPRPPRRRRAPSAEDVEDALIDAQLR